MRGAVYQVGTPEQQVHQEEQAAHASGIEQRRHKRAVLPVVAAEELVKPRRDVPSPRRFEFLHVIDTTLCLLSIILTRFTPASSLA